MDADLPHVMRAYAGGQRCVSSHHARDLAAAASPADVVCKKQCTNVNSDVNNVSSSAFAVCLSLDHGLCSVMPHAGHTVSLMVHLFGAVWLLRQCVPWRAPVCCRRVSEGDQRCRPSQNQQE